MNLAFFALLHFELLALFEFIFDKSMTKMLGDKFLDISLDSIFTQTSLTFKNSEQTRNLLDLHSTYNTLGDNESCIYCTFEFCTICTF